METIEEKTNSYTKDIRLPGIRKNDNTFTEEFNSRDTDYQLFLCKLLEVAYTSRVESRKVSRIRQAGFPYTKYEELTLLQYYPTAPYHDSNYSDTENAREERKRIFPIRISKDTRVGIRNTNKNKAKNFHSQPDKDSDETVLPRKNIISHIR